MQKAKRSHAHHKPNPIVNAYIAFGILLFLLAPVVAYFILPRQEIHEDLSIFIFLVLIIVGVPCFVLLMQKKGMIWWFLVCVAASLWPLMFAAVPYIDGTNSEYLVVQLIINLGISTVFSGLAGTVVWFLWYHRKGDWN